MEAWFGDFDLVGVGTKVESVVGCSSKTIIDEDLSLFRVRRSS